MKIKLTMHSEKLLSALLLPLAITQCNVCIAMHQRLVSAGNNTHYQGAQHTNAQVKEIHWHHAIGNKKAQALATAQFQALEKVALAKSNQLARRTDDEPGESWLSSAQIQFRALERAILARRERIVEPSNDRSDDTWSLEEVHAGNHVLPTAATVLAETNEARSSKVEAQGESAEPSVPLGTRKKHKKHKNKGAKLEAANAQQAAATTLLDTVKKFLPDKQCLEAHELSGNTSAPAAASSDNSLHGNELRPEESFYQLPGQSLCVKTTEKINLWLRNFDGVPDNYTLTSIPYHGMPLCMDKYLEGYGVRYDDIRGQNGPTASFNLYGAVITKDGYAEPALFNFIVNTSGALRGNCFHRQAGGADFKTSFRDNYNFINYRAQVSRLEKVSEAVRIAQERAAHYRDTMTPEVEYNFGSGMVAIRTILQKVDTSGLLKEFDLIYVLFTNFSILR